jgi:hypothetical protein
MQDNASGAKLVVVEGSDEWPARELQERTDHLDLAPEPARVALAGRHQH